MSFAPPPKELFKTDRKLYVMNAKDIQSNLSWRPKKRKVHMKPIIIPPISGKKGVMHKRIDPLWNDAGIALQNANRIVISGYSCPPLDFEARILISENLRKNDSKDVYVVNPDMTSASTFSELCGVKNITLYENLSSWNRDISN
jgi:hypothetical protein